jgi:hypothetical protein
MRKSKISMFRLARIFMGILLLSTSAVAAWPQGTPDFSGLWKQASDRCQPKRNGDVTMRIEHRDPQFTVETTIMRASASPRHAVQNYTTDGKVSLSTGTDGDEFHTSVIREGADLVFSIEEHEDGRILRSKETWSLIEDGATLQRTRERGDGEKQTLFYRRQKSGSN